MQHFFLSLWRGFSGRCPVCGRGRVFYTYYKVRERCEHCGIQFEASSGQSTGGMAINLVLTLFLGFVGGIVLVLNAPDQLFLGLAALLAVMTLFHVVFYRFARGLWLGIITLTGDIGKNQDEQ